MKLPKVTSTTEIVRNISVITETPKDQIHIITKGSKEIGVYTPIELFKKISKYKELDNIEAGDSLKINAKLANKLKTLKAVEFQREIRKEY